MFGFEAYTKEGWIKVEESHNDVNRIAQEFITCLEELTKCEILAEQLSQLPQPHSPQQGNDIAEINERLYSTIERVRNLSF